jgi:hypothetical protein
MSEYHKDDVGVDEYEDQAGLGPRSVTDWPCCLLFIGYMVWMGCLFQYSLENGEIKRLTHGFDYIGNLCGVDPVVVNDPYLFWCGGLGFTAGIPTSLNLENPICVDSCPIDDNTLVPCPQPSKTIGPIKSGNSTAGDPPGTGTYTTEIIQQVVAVPTYPTEVFASKYCMPKDVHLMKTLLEDGPMGGTLNQVMQAAGSVRRAWYLLAGIALLSLILGYAYLIFMKIFAKPLVYGALIILVVACLGAGAYMIHTAPNASVPAAAVLDDGASAEDPGEVAETAATGGISENEVVRQNLFAGVAGEYAVETSYAVGGILVVMGLVFLVLLFCARESIDIAVACVGEACNTMFAMPSLLLQPAVEVGSKLIALSVLLYGLGWLFSTGEIKAESANIGGVELRGVHRSFNYTEEQMYYILSYIFGVFWVDEIFTAMSQFVVSYSVVLYYFCPKDASGYKEAPSFPLFRGYFVGFIYHIGTIAFGAALIAIVRIISLILSYVAKQAEKEGNAALACIAKLLVCIVQCFKRCLEFINKNAYMDVAYRSSWFCTAAKNALKMIMQEATLMALLNGACFIFQIAGGLLISLAGGYAAYLGCQQDLFTNPLSEYYVDNPIAVTIAGFLVGLTVAVPFMLTFDQCADTLLYCYVMDKVSPGDHDYCPDQLKEVIDHYGPH